MSDGTWDADYMQREAEQNRKELEELEIDQPFWLGSINATMLFKLRDERICVILYRGEDWNKAKMEPVLYSKEQIGKYSGVIPLSDYKDDLTIKNTIVSNKFDVMAIKKFSSQSKALATLLNLRGEAEKKAVEWDWIREEEVG